jgi:hypothetical protein
MRDVIEDRKIGEADVEVTMTNPAVVEHRESYHPAGCPQ